MLVDDLLQTKNKYKNLKKQNILRYISQNKLDKTCFHHDMAFGYFKDLPRRIAPDKVLHNKTFNVAKNQKYYGYQRSHASMVYKYFDKKTSGSAIENEILLNQGPSDLTTQQTNY